MATANKIEVKAVKGSIVLFYNGKNCGVGWKRVAPKDMAAMIKDLEEEFPLLNIHEEFTVITGDLLMDLEFLTNKEREIATGKFMEYFKPATKNT